MRDVEVTHCKVTYRKDRIPSVLGIPDRDKVIITNRYHDHYYWYYHHVPLCDLFFLSMMCKNLGIDSCHHTYPQKGSLKQCR